MRGQKGGVQKYSEEEVVQEEEGQVPPRQCYRGRFVQSRSLLPTSWNEDLSGRAPSARSIFSFACAWPRQSLWQLPSPAARYKCAAVVYTRSRSCSLLTPHTDRKIYDPALFFGTALGRFKRVGLLVRENCLGGIRPAVGMWAARGRKGLTGQGCWRLLATAGDCWRLLARGWEGGASCPGGKASWGWAAPERRRDRYRVLCDV